MDELDELGWRGAKVDSGECSLRAWDINDPQSLCGCVVTSFEDAAALVGDLHQGGVELCFASIITELTDRQ